MKILIFGLPGSGKSTLAKPLAELIGGVHINADEVRKEYNDWDFSIQARVRQAQRMRYLADGVVRAGKVAVVDFVCPMKETREVFAPDFTVWMDTIESGRYDDTNLLFQKPDTVDYHVSAWFDDTHKVLFEVVRKWMERNNK